MEHVSNVYVEQYESPTPHLKVSCTDEKTGIQAIENITIQPVMEGRPERRDPEYTRNGTQMLMASRDVATGEINAYTIGQERKEEDFLNHVKDIVATAPGLEHLIVCDQLNTHKSASLAEWVAREIGFTGDLGKKGLPLFNSTKLATVCVSTNSDTIHRLSVLQFFQLSYDLGSHIE